MLRVAIVGCGGMARTYRKTYAGLPGVEWSLAVDVNADELGRCVDAGAKRTSTRFEDALADDIDVVDVSTPNHLHADQAIAALKAGKHVIVQKPISNSLADADRIVDAAERSDRHAGMFMSSYNNPLIWDIKQLIEEGKLGTIQAIHARDSHRGGLRATPGAWRGDRKLTGGGSFIQLSIHAINLIRFFLNERISEVIAIQQNTLSPNIGGDDLTACIARYPSGVVGTFTSAYASDGVERAIYGTKGRICLSKSDRVLNLNLDEPFHGNIIHYDTPCKDAVLQHRAAAYDDPTCSCNGQRRFIESVLRNESPRFHVLDGRNDLAVVDAVYRSGEQNGAPVRVQYRETKPKLQANVYLNNAASQQPVMQTAQGA